MDAQYHEWQDIYVWAQVTHHKLDMLSIDITTIEILVFAIWFPRVTAQ